jgi:hypothetical protein
VNREEFEASVLDLWMSTRIPLSRAHLQYHTGLGRQKVERWLDELTAEGVVECDVDDEGEMLWRVPGAARSTSGPRTFAELGRSAGSPRKAAGSGKQRRAADADDPLESIRAAMTLAKTGTAAARRQAAMQKKDGDNEKSLAVSAGLSLLGPIGWLYAGSLREAAVATLAAALVWKLTPAFLLMPILWLALPLSAVVGLVYAWQHNRNGQRTPLFLDGDKDEPKKGKKKRDDD